jgi:hypothetical protein
MSKKRGFARQPEQDKQIIELRLFFMALSLVLAFALNGYGQGKNIELSLTFLSNKTLGTVNFERNSFFEHLKKTRACIEKLFANSNQKRDLLIIHTFHKSLPPSFEIYSRPMLDESARTKILSELLSITPLYSKIVDYSLLYSVRICGGHTDRDARFSPDFVSPAVKTKRAFAEADLSSKYGSTKNWAKEYAIPILAAFESKVDMEYVGVRAIGNLLSKTDFGKKQDVIQLTDRNPLYWRAILEMSTGNQIIPVSMIMMHVAQGDFDYVHMYLNVIHFFSSKECDVNYLLDELRWRLRLFYKDLRMAIKEGVRLHDAGMLDDSIDKYTSILKAYPNSAWANYEHYYSNRVKSVASNGILIDNWDVAKSKIYKCNPLYPLDVKARNGREGYLMFRRNQISTLFKNKSQLASNLIEYADIALELEVYGFSANLYWWISRLVPSSEYKPKKILSHFLYCLDKLGNKDIVNYFKGDFNNDFNEIDKEKVRLMKESKIYKAFEKKK